MQAFIFEPPLTPHPHAHKLVVAFVLSSSSSLTPRGIFRLPPWQDGIVVGAVGAYDWNGGVLKETRQGKVVPPKSSYSDEFPEELKNHGAYLGELQLTASIGNQGSGPG